MLLVKNFCVSGTWDLRLILRSRRAELGQQGVTGGN
jgi:hypothetical protein